MNKLTRPLLAALVLSAATLSSFAANTLATNQASVQNETSYNLEFSGLIGGYVSNNPLTQTSQQNVSILPDPGSTLVRGHIMVYSNTPGHYIDNIVFVYQLVQGNWQLQAYDLYSHLTVTVQNNMLSIKE